MSNITTLMEFLNNPIIDASTYALRYMGHYDKDREYALGDVIYDKNSDVFSVCTSENKFEPISSGIAEKPYTEVPTNKYKLIGKCPYCNASLNLTKFNKQIGYTKCEYCDSTIIFEEERFDDPVFMQQEKMHTMPSDT